MTQKADQLRKLQKLDREIKEAGEGMAAIEEKVEEVELPALSSEKDLADAESRLDELRREERRLARSLTVYRERSSRLEERAKMVRNLREENAVNQEMDTVRRALASDEAEHHSALDQIRRLEEAAGRLAQEAAETRAAVDPMEAELREEQRGIEARLSELKGERARTVRELDGGLRRLYEGASRGGSRQAVSGLDEDACGLCYAVIPLQQRLRVRAGGNVQCEACGVIVIGA